MLGLLQFLEPCVVVDVLGLGNSLEHRLDTRHHSLKTTEVNVGTVFELFENFVGVFFDLVLDVHLSSLAVVLFTRQSVIDAEVFRVLLLGELEFVIVKEGVRVGNTKEQPGFTLVGGGGGCVFGEQTTDESTVRGDTGSGGNHDKVGIGVFFGDEHNLSGRSGHHDFVTGVGVAKEVGADTGLGWIVGLEFWAPVVGTTDAQGSGLSGLVVTVTTGGDGVKTDRVGLSVLFSVARGHDTPGLSFPVRKVSIVIDDDVASLAGGLGSDNALGGDNLSGERGLVLPDVHGNSRLIIVWFGLKEVFSSNLGAVVVINNSGVIKR